MAKKFYLSCFFFSLAGLAGCAARSVLLVHPQNGATATCGAQGAGIMAGGVEGVVQECLRKYEGQGYVPVEKLTADERANLERRGFLPKSEKPSPSLY